MHPVIKKPIKALARPFRLTVPCRVLGHWYRIPIEGDLGWQNFSAGTREPFVAEEIRRRVGNSTGVFLDVGANLGQTLLVARAVAPGVPYIGIEPNVRCCAYLHRLSAINGFQDVQFVCAGAAQQSGIGELGIPEGPVETCTFSPDRTKQRRYAMRQTTPLLSLDDIVDRPLAFVKVDVEGFELEALKGLEKTLRRDTPPIIFEVLPFANSEYVLELTAFLRSIGYGMHALGGSDKDGKEIVVGDRNDYLATV